MEIAATNQSAMWVGRPFNPRNNSLNLLRLILATSVLFHHSFPLMGLGEGPDLHGDAIGGWAVVGFFCISGYLIAASRSSKSFGDYLSLRIARIFPGFIICNLVTVVVFAPIAWAYVNHTWHGYLSTPTTPLNYLWSNLGLKMANYDVASTPVNVPYPHAWNGSLWSLYYEFICYLLVGLLGSFALFRRSPWGTTAVWGGTVVFQALLPITNRYFQTNSDIVQLAKLLPYFMAGAVLAEARKRIGMHWTAGLASAAGFMICLLGVPGWGGQLGSLFLVYFLLWAGSVVPCPQIIQVHDISYGMYIYAFQVQQMLAVFGVFRLGYWWFSLLALGITIVLAIGSWLVVERPVMTAVRRAIKSPSLRVAGEVGISRVAASG